MPNERENEATDEWIKLDRQAISVDSEGMVSFKKNWWKLLILSFPAYCIAYYLLPIFYEVSSPEECPEVSLRTFHCFLLNSSQFPLLPFQGVTGFFKALSEGPPASDYAELALVPLIWFASGFLFFLVVFSAVYFLLFKFVPWLLTRWKAGRRD